MLQNLFYWTSTPPTEDHINRLQKITSTYSDQELLEADPKDFMKIFLHQISGHYLEIEMIMQAIAVYSVKQTVESVLESLVSKYENHFTHNRNMDEGNVNEEFEIATNGPCLAFCNSVVEEAMVKYWEGKPWHFFTNSALHPINSQLSQRQSKVIRKLKNCHSKFPFME